MAIAGNEKGKTGVVLARRGDRVVVQGLNVRKKNVRRSQQSPQGGTIDKEMAIHVSNVMVCPEGGRPVRLKVRVNAEGERELFFRDSKSGSETAYRSLKKNQ